MEPVLNCYRFRWGLLGLVTVYLSGWVAPLFENDSAQFAVMALRMVREGDYLSLYKGAEPYLDKPHLHYWISALSLKLFGAHDWAYRLPGLLAALLAGVSVHGLGTVLYHRSVGRLAAWMFLSSQTIVLSLTDLRTDAWLVAFVSLALWQWALYNRYGELRNLLVCAMATGLAFSTKGHIALVVIGSAVLADTAWTRRWDRLLNVRLLLALVVFALSISPVLYAYYIQFDLHPELVIRGRDQRSGVWFILWEQSFERLSGEGIGKNSPDYFFFFHTFLWVFLPWTLYGLLAVFDRSRRVVLNRFRFRPSREFLTLGTILLVFPLISAAQFKLPHYLNILIPVFAVLTAALLSRQSLYRHPGTRRLLSGMAFGITVLYLLVIWVLCAWVFPLAHWSGYVLLVLGSGLCLRWALPQDGAYNRVVSLLLYSSVFLNLVMNLHFYPRLLDYQAGSTMAAWVQQQGIPPGVIYKVSDGYTWSMDFYLDQPLTRISEEQITGLTIGSYLYLNQDEWSKLAGRPGLRLVHQVEDFRITRLSLQFLRPGTRADAVGQRYLVRKE